MKTENVRKILGEFSLNTVNRAKKNLKVTGFGGQKRGRKKESSGRLGKSLGFKITESSRGLITDFTSTEKYASIVEDGRASNSRMPPVDELVKWMRQKPVRLRNEGGQFRKSTPQAMRSAAFAMAKSIAKRGIKPVPFFSEAMNTEFEKLPPLIQTAMVADMEDLLFDDFQKMKNFNVKKT